MKFKIHLCPGLAVIAVLAAPNFLPAQSTQEKMVGFVQEHCVDCHSGGDSAEAGLDLEDLSFELSDSKAFERWTRIVDQVERGDMPPESESQPKTAQRQQFVDAVQKGLTRFNQKQQQESGRTAIRRLNRKEYERTVQDLLGITMPLQHMLPEESPLHGFDTVSDALRFSALHIDHYLNAADAALDEAIRLTKQPEKIDKRFQYTEQEGVLKNLKEDKVVIRLLDNAAVFFSKVSYISKVHGMHIATPGIYRMRARGWAFQSDKPVVMRLHAGNYKTGTVRLLGYFDIQPDEPREVEVVVRLEYNEYIYPLPDDLMLDPDGSKNVWNVGGDKYGGSGLAVEWVEVEGPLQSEWPPQSTTELFEGVPIEKMKHEKWNGSESIVYELKPQDSEKSIESVITRFAAKAFRRPVKQTDTARYVQISRESLASGRSFEDAVRVGLRAILCSPQFLILHETPGTLDDFALASRLSYFLWGTMPDEALMQLAGENKLSDPAVLREQTNRLLKDPRSETFIEDFVDQWLDLQRIDATSPDKMLYPEYDDLLKDSMLAESRGFFRELVAKDLSVRNLVDSDFSMLNRRLAEHYEIDDVQGQQLQRVTLPEDSRRGGVLTQAAVLKVTANGTVSSPVTRGAWVMTRILNDPPSPPPPAVGSIEPDTRGATTVREQLDLHRRDPSCASCHVKIDPPGFALESFDVIGGYREYYRSTDKGERVDRKLHGKNIWQYKAGPPVDSSGQTADGTEFQDVRDFKRLLLREPERIANSLASHLIVYATGEKIEFADREVVRKIVSENEQSDYGVRSLIHSIVQSELFRRK